MPDLSVLPPGTFDPAIDIEQETESNHDTALTLAAAGTLCILKIVYLRVVLLLYMYMYCSLLLQWYVQMYM